MTFYTRVPFRFWLIMIAMIPTSLKAFELPMGGLKDTALWIIAIYWGVSFIIFGLANLDTGR